MIRKNIALYLKKCKSSFRYLFSKQQDIQKSGRLKSLKVMICKGSSTKGNRRLRSGQNFFTIREKQEVSSLVDSFQCVLYIYISYEFLAVTRNMVLNGLQKKELFIIWLVLCKLLRPPCRRLLDGNLIPGIALRDSLFRSVNPW